MPTPRMPLALLAAAVLACSDGGGAGGPLDPGEFRSDDFPAGEAFIFGVVKDAVTDNSIPGLTVTITPSEGQPFEVEIASPVLAEDRTGSEGEFSFSGIARGNYVLFIRFHSNNLGYGEVVGRVEASVAPSELTLFITPIGLTFQRPVDGGTVAATDTAIVVFRPIRVEELRTLDPATRPLRLGVDVNPTSNPDQPRQIRVPVSVAELRAGQVRVPLDAGGLGGSLRLESFLELEIVYRDPREAFAGTRPIRGAPVQVVRR